jgi:hypothetical protein
MCFVVLSGFVRGLERLGIVRMLGEAGYNSLKAVRERELTSAERAICSLVYAFGSEDEEIQKD